ncbi:MAG: hypothetical protein HKL85_05750 [Acidimicrobiaceae bacterium]|nr:hypothetical protein [Acidimicrobiaceae bacterium]
MAKGVATRFSRPSRQWALYGASGVMVAGVTFATIGFAPLLFLAGAWAYAAVTNRWVTALSGPTSWMAGIVLEATFLIGESGTLAIVMPHPQPQWVYIVMLITPLVVAFASYKLLSAKDQARTPARPSPVSGEPLLAMMCVVLIESMFEAIKLHGNDFGLTWFMTGDARNQVVGTRQILGAGGITLKEMTSYPALVNAISAVFDGAGGRSNLGAAALMVRDVQAMVATVILTCVGVALSFIAAISETFTRSERDARRLPLYLVIPLGACGSIAIGALFLGLGSSGGFLSAMGALVFALAALVLGMRIASGYENVTLVLLTFSLVLVVGSWTFLAVVPALAIVFGLFSGGRRYVELRRVSPASVDARSTKYSLGFAFIGLFAILGALVFKGATLVAQLKTTGGIIAGNPRIFDWLGIVVVAVALVAPNPRQRFVRLLLVGQFIGLAAIVAWMYVMHPGGVAWSYYATKMLWLATCTVVWIPFVLLTDVMRKVDQWVRRVGARAVSHLALALVGSGGLLWGVSHETPYPFPWHWAFIGSTFPSPMIIQAVIKESNAGTPFIFWQYSGPADDKMGNFWSALTWDYTANGALKATKSAVAFPTWASAEQGSLTELCHIVSNYRLRIVTKNPSLIPTLLRSCKGYLPIPSQAHLR